MMKEDSFDHKRGNITQAPNIIPKLPNDIAMEILSRLPPLSIIRFKPVCRTWLTLFSSADIIKIHLDRAKISQESQEDEYLIIQNIDVHTASSNRISLVHIDKPKTNINLEHSFNKILSGMELIGSSNGLVCLRCHFSVEGFILWNPITSQCKNLPCAPVTFYPDVVLNISLGFYFDIHMNDYIVLRIERIMKDTRKIAKVMSYSLNFESWREIDVEVNFPISSSNCDVIVKGEPYWWAREYRDGPSFVVWFDTCNMVFRRVPNLIIMRRNEYNEEIMLVNYKSSLAMLVDSSLTLPSFTSKYLGLGFLYEISERTINMLVMDNEGSWHWELRVSFPQGINRVVGCSKRGRIVLEDNSGTIVLFDHKKNETESTRIVGALAKKILISNYTPNFVSIEGSEHISPFLSNFDEV